MKNFIISAMLVGSFISLTTTESSAVIYCAAGVYRAGCIVRPAGGAVVVAPRAVVVAPVVVVPVRPVVVAPVRRRVY